MTIGRRQFAASALGTLAASAQPPQTRPNVVYFILDDLGMYDLSCFGSKEIETPNIDRLAAQGMKFTAAYSGCTVCAPARATLMTGKHMGHTSLRANPGGISLAGSDFTLAELLRKAGYVCGGFGKWGMGDLDTEGVPEKKGFDRFFGYYHQVHAHHYYPDYLIDTGRKVPLPGNAGFYDAKPPAGAYPLRDAATGRERQHSAPRIQREMLTWLRAQGKQPFFCYAPITIPHGLHHVPDSDAAWLKFKDKPWPVEARVNAAFVTMADRFVGEAMTVLHEMGVADNTLVFFSSDNGTANTFGGSLNSGGSLRGQKTQVYEGGIRIPFIASFSGRIKAGSTSDLPVYFPDIMPTVAEFTGTSEWLPNNLDGMSFAAEARGKQRLSRNRPMYWEWNEDHFRLPYRVSKQACRKGPWKIVRHDSAKPWELYDLSADPNESRNLAAERPELVKELDAWVAANRVDPPPQMEPAKPQGQRWR